MGIYNIGCPDCGRTHQWHSNNFDQRCGVCRNENDRSNPWVQTDGPLGTDELINGMIGDIDAVIMKYTKIMQTKELSPKDAYYIMMMALAERTALQIYGAKKQIITTTDEMLDIFNDAIRQILKRAEGFE